MTVKEYALQQHISQQTVYYKIRKYSDKLKNHVYKKNGKTFLDETAQEMLKPVEGNVGLVDKVKMLEADIVKKNDELKNWQKEYRLYKENNELLIKEADDYKKHIADLERELSDEKAKTVVMEKRITELTDKASAFENFAERLNALLGVLEETANTGMGKKLGNLLSGKH